MSEPIHGDPNIDKEIDSIVGIVEGYVDKSSFWERRNCGFEIHLRGYRAGVAMMEKHQKFLAEKAIQSEKVRSQMLSLGIEKFRLQHQYGEEIVDALEKYPSKAYLKIKKSLDQKLNESRH